MQLLGSLALLALLPGSCAPSSDPPDDGEFGDVWYDGRAELSGYRWEGTRYGELRTGEAVAIFVTEPFGAESHVKVDRPDDADEPVVTALKLNLVREFQTGLYDYDTMVSCFVDARDFTLLKSTFTSAEWCGHVYEEVDARDDALTVDVASYFQGESGRRELEPASTTDAGPDALVGEQLFLWLRGLRGDVLAPGESRTLRFVTGAFERRLRHEPARWGELRVSRERATSEVEVPAGRFPAIAFQLSASDGRTGRVVLEEAYPHRILSWEWRRGDERLDAGTLLGSTRLPYWQLNGEGEEALRARIGLATR